MFPVGSRVQGRLREELPEEGRFWRRQVRLYRRMYGFIVPGKPRVLSLRLSLPASARPLAGVSLVAAAVLLGGCSIAVPVGDMFGADETLTTSSLAANSSPAANGATMLSPELAPEDWPFARMALGTALDPLGSGQVAPWANPRTGIRGDVVAVGKPYLHNDLVCRRFKANLYFQGQSDALAGAACRLSDGQWATMDVSAL
jgi:surface antigen